MKGLRPDQIEVPVVGGHSGVTILPLLSQVPGITFSDEEVNLLTRRIRNAGTEVVEAKAGAGSATLAMGYAAARFTLSLVRALQGLRGIIECAYVESESAFSRFLPNRYCWGRRALARGGHWVSSATSSSRRYRICARRSIRILRSATSSCSSSPPPP
ncbi:Malate dehydrogenase [Sodalis praecaptivus]